MTKNKPKEEQLEVYESELRKKDRKIRMLMTLIKDYLDSESATKKDLKEYYDSLKEFM